MNSILQIIHILKLYSFLTDSVTDLPDIHKMAYLFHEGSILGEVNIIIHKIQMQSDTYHGTYLPNPMKCVPTVGEI